LTYSGKIGSLIDDVIKSSRDGIPHNANDAPQARAQEAARQPGGRVFDPRYASLLARIVTEQPTAETPCVQFMTCQPGDRACRIAFGTAHAAATILGRTLLLNTRLDDPCDPSARAAGHQLEQTAGGTFPDAFVQRLYHRQLFCNDADLALLYGRSRKDALLAIAAPFRLVVIDAGDVADGPAAEGLAPFCLGTVLVVAAGRASQARVNNAGRLISAAGGRVVGTVLTDAPADLPRWIKAR
jgi:hypothetical protein